ncbi:carbamate kinase [Anaerococcus urinomassiliensis]|uniref:carbamate kinase n=1 Tax=Anaerococcus urinomassiliensis TaxID=1745712 RepID=UPI00093C822B|nr:carbamate kinase [Anaerococcus urinomassiliensis]
MSKKRLVIALGGNALGKTPEEQLELVTKTAESIVDLSEEYDLAIGHGNGPQVGMINNAFEYAALNGAGTPAMPFPECGAMSQGYIGYHLQQSVRNELKKRGINKNVATVLTQVLVDENDEAFKNPTKPIGSFMTKEEADEIAKEKGYTFVEDAGRGYRRVVASPIPKEIVELDVVNSLIENDNIVITVGGGGIPVIDKEDKLEGIPAVIDKDRSSALLAEELEADMLVILTAVDQVMINFGKENEEAIKEMTLEEAEKYIGEEQFAKGSMLPKVEACMEFVENTENGIALITSLEKAAEALKGQTGTIIKK